MSVSFAAAMNRPPSPHETAELTTPAAILASMNRPSCSNQAIRHDQISHEADGHAVERPDRECGHCGEWRRLYTDNRCRHGLVTDMSQRDTTERHSSIEQAGDRTTGLN